MFFAEDKCNLVVRAGEEKLNHSPFHCEIK